MATCRIVAALAAKEESKAEGKADLSSLTSMLQARWKGGAPVRARRKPEAIHAGQIRSFRIIHLDSDTKKIELELA